MTVRLTNTLMLNPVAIRGCFELNRYCVATLSRDDMWLFWTE